MGTEWIEGGLKITFDPGTLNALWQGFLSWGWMLAGGLVFLAAVVRMMGFRIKKARAYMKEHPGVFGRAVFGVTLASIVLGSAAFGLNTWHKASEAALTKDLPGVWRVLYEQMGEFTEHEARMVALSVFTENASDELPPLPFAGFSRLMTQALDDQQAGSNEWANLKTILEKFVKIE